MSIRWVSATATATDVRDPTYPLVIKHGNGKSPVDKGFNKKITDKWSIFQHAMFDYRKVLDQFPTAMVIWFEVSQECQHVRQWLLLRMNGRVWDHGIPLMCRSAENVRDSVASGLGKSVG